MFKVSSKFAMAFLALSLTAIISVLAACGDDSSPGGTEAPISSSSATPPDPPPINVFESFTASGTLLDGDLYLNISGEVKTETGFELLSYQVKLTDGTEIIPATTPSDPQLVSFSETYTFAEGQCCSETDQFKVQLFVTWKDVEKNETTVSNDVFPFNKQRNYPACLPKVSSSSASSSSAKPLEFRSITSTPVLLKGSGSDARGISLSQSGVEVKNDCTGHICYEATSSNGSLSLNGVKVQTVFSSCQGGATIKYVPQDPEWEFSENCEIPNPQNVSKFPLSNNGPQGSGPVEFSRAAYFMVRVGSATSNQWTVGTDYLVAFTNEQATTGNPRTIKIVAWTVE